MRSFLHAVGALVLLVGCATVPPVAPHATRDPPTLPVLSWESDVISWLVREGLNVTYIAGSKWESFFAAPALPARYFRGDRGVVEIVYVKDRPLDARVCETRDGSRYRYRITGYGREQSIDAAAPMFFSLSADYFSIVFRDAQVGDLARRAIGGVAPAC